ncbi:hypothetical protein [Oscillatoria salina]|uniref:hypothetical protein n=1 Tax=Oscillatoria salina TaxID=331517 RepID=UPI0013B91B0B|nr:hypothetical protein [Oscillatoria salina]MBZ8180040.1 hypothetical protein [Oscillatoria salina IIICB1]NET88910.1 hypothetical protein [Kamptonema sp. SIO1D9]
MRSQTKFVDDSARFDVSTISSNLGAIASNSRIAIAPIILASGDRQNSPKN